MPVPFDITFHPSWWHKNAGVQFTKEFFNNPSYRIEADRAMRRVLFDRFGDLGLGEKDPSPRPILGSDLIASGYLHSTILGCGVRFTPSNPPEVLCPNLSDEAAAALSVPDLEQSEAWQPIKDQIETLTRQYGYVESCINLMGIQNIALDLRGQELFIDYFNNPEIAHHLLDVCLRLSIKIGTRLRQVSKGVSAGVTAIVKQTVPNVYLTSNCTVEMVSLDIYNQFLLRYDTILAEHFQPFGIHHCGRTMEHVVAGYQKVPHLTFAEVGAFSDIETVRKSLPHVFLNARYSPVKLKDVPYAELEEDIGAIINQSGPEHLLSISCVGIDSGVPDSQIRNFLAICRTYYNNQF